jgi:hypothetical protein
MDETSPSAATARIAGRVSRAVSSKSVVKSPITTAAENPTGRRSAG